MNYLRKLRLEAGLTQREVAEGTGLNRQTISRLEVGRHLPCTETLLRLAGYYAVDSTDLWVRLTQPGKRYDPDLRQVIDDPVV